MVGGQMIDLLASNEDYDIRAITRLQQLKTGKLMAVSCEMGAILGQATEACHHALRNYAYNLGLAFQIADDLLDHEGSEEAMGKAVGKDAAAGKATFVSLLGVERARTQARKLINQAVAHLDHFGEKAGLLQEAARYVVERKS